MVFGFRKNQVDTQTLPPLKGTSRQIVLDAYAAGSAGKRLVNEDAFHCQLSPKSPGWLVGIFIVADGIGGRQNGSVASSVAVAGAINAIVDTKRLFSKDSVRGLLNDAFENAHKSVIEASGADANLAGMGTTLTIGLVAQGCLFVASLGDSRAYLWRERSLVLLTEDGWLRTQEADINTGSHKALDLPITIVDRAVGWDNDYKPTQTDTVIGAGDIMLFCTDGLTDGLNQREIESILHKFGKRPELCAKRLITNATREAGADNTTVVIARACT